jgi:hypothetical protein
MYHEESRKLQDQFDTRRLADRLVERLVRSTFTDEDRKFIEGQRMFFLATTDADGFPDCSYKGGDPGFVHVLDERTLVFPSYVQEPGEHPRKSCGRPAFHELRDAEAPAGQWHCNGELRRCRDGVVPRRTACRAVDAAARFPELPALHPENADGGAVALRAARGMLCSRSEMEDVAAVQGCPSSQRPRT